MRGTQNSILILGLLMILTSGPVNAQQELPREYAVEEYISLDERIGMADALTIINELSEKYENKIIIDDKDRNQPIGVMVDHMHWKRALEYILRTNKLIFVEHPRHYEILSEGKKEDKEIQRLIQMDTREIEIKAVFFEADYQSINEIGVDWSTLHDGRVQLRVDNMAASQVNQNIFSAQISTTKFLNVSALIKAFESHDRGQIIANPQIRIMDGEQGKIKVGRNFFLTTRDFAGNTRYSEYESGTILTVLPQVIKQDEETFIHLDIRAEKSDVEVTSLGVTKKVTEGATQVLLLNGEQTALAGLFSNQRSSVRKGIPLLKDLPWWFLGLRYITGYNSTQENKKELIILIEAEIVPSLNYRMKTKRVKSDIMDKRRQEFRTQTQRLTQ
jgi:type IV pilus assembly protein PilQ